MTKFDKNLTVISQLERFKDGSRWFNERLVISDCFQISIQAGYANYSSPREDRDSNEDYEEFEIAIFKREGDNWEFIQPRDIFSNFYWSEFFEPGDKPVAGYIPLQELEIIVRDIDRVSPLIQFA